MIAEPAQTFQALVDIEKSRLAVHRLVFDSFNAMESEIPSFASFSKCPVGDAGGQPLPARGADVGGQYSHIQVLPLKTRRPGSRSSWPCPPSERWAGPARL
jgi:hypothetical protein